ERRTPNPDAGGSSPSWPASFSRKRAENMEKIKLIMNKALQFVSQAKAELKKVTWPTRKQTLASTGVVMVIVAIMALYLGIIDLILAKVVKFILG
ncbi:MAG TPA: preprotein translocase subunit SecE, partial [Smithellaceae bacterium]|nr:preprotein translocase subunit SecE [Smithellaceae bacterium]